MAQVLPPALLAVQDAAVRSPVVELKASSFDESIPFKGNAVDENFTDESGLTAILHSTGRACMAYIVDSGNGANGYIQYVYTNTDRSEFNYVRLFDIGIGSELLLCELKDKALGLLVNSGGLVTVYILTIDGHVTMQQVLAGMKGGFGFGILSRAEDYLLLFSQPTEGTLPRIGGNYTSGSLKEYILVVTRDGTNHTAAFRYAAEEIVMGGGQDVPMESGLTIAFPISNYYKGQEFYFTAYPATYSSAKLQIDAIPQDGAKITIRNQTYTFRNELTEFPNGGQLPYEVKIDAQSKEITLENLNCAINRSSYEETGEGTRYATGTAANIEVSSSRRRGETFLTLTARQSGNLTYAVIFGVGCGLSGGNVIGGKNSSVSKVSASPGCKTYSATSADFLQWSVPGGLELPGVVPSRTKTGYSFTVSDTGLVLLWFDCVTAGRTDITAVTNIFYAVSTDGGHTWGKASPVTNHQSPQIIAKKAHCIEETTNHFVLAYQEMQGCLFIDRLTQGHPFSTNFYGGHLFNFDFVRRRGYVSLDDAINGVIYGILEIDLDEWRILRYWNEETAPALPWMLTLPEQEITNLPYWLSPAVKSSGRYQVLVKPVPHFAYVLDTLTNRDVEIYFADYTSPKDSHYRFSSNVNYSGSQIAEKHCPLGAYVDEDENKLWVVLGTDMAWAEGNCQSKREELACVDLEQIFDPNVNRYDVNVSFNLTFRETLHQLKWMDYSKEYDAWVFIWSYSESYGQVRRCIRVIDAQSGGYLHHIDHKTCGNFPLGGMDTCTLYGGKLYGNPLPTENEAKYNGIRGLCIVDLAAMQANYHIPPITGENIGANVGKVIVTEDEKAIFYCNKNICIYDIPGDFWTTVNSVNTPGFTDYIYATDCHLAYDVSSGSIYIFSGSLDTPRLQMVNMGGKIERLVYRSAAFSDQSLTIEDAKPLVKGSGETNGYIFYADEQLYAFWQHKKAKERRIFWDKETGALDLSSYLLRGEEIAMTKSIDGSPNTLSFSLSDGHLFDPTNARSLLRIYAKKGKKISLRLGEEADGTIAWQTHLDEFIITSSSLTFQRGKYPSISIICADRRTLFSDLRITATPYYAKTAPHTVLAGILQEYGGYGAAHLSIEAFDEPEAAIRGQFIDKSISEIIEDIGSRFGYFPAVLPGDIFTMRKINLDAPLAHTYSGSVWMVNYTPDDSFSDMTNKITVVGESPDKTAVVMPEELAVQDSGTIGWYKRKNTKRLYYSDDGQKECVNPRLVKIESAAGIAFQLAGKVKEYIDNVDRTNNSYVDVKIEAPDLTPVFLAAVAMIVTAKNMPPVVVPPDPQTGAGGGTAQSKEAAIMESTGMWLALQCLGAVANYQFEIYAQPVGYVRRSFQYSVTDDELIRELNGTIIEKKIDDPLCYTADHCRIVAELEMRITKAQRSRVKMTKIAHLQDEVGDIIAINHPYNKLQQRIFITDITRRIRIPETGSSNGSVLDELEGWKL